LKRCRFRLPRREGKRCGVFSLVFYSEKINIHIYLQIYTYLFGSSKRNDAAPVPALATDLNINIFLKKEPCPLIIQIFESVVKGEYQNKNLNYL
jgi:hypothetical protein